MHHHHHQQQQQQTPADLAHLLTNITETTTTALTEIRLLPNSPLIFTTPTNSSHRTFHSISLVSPSGPNLGQQVTISIYSTIAPVGTELEEEMIGMGMEGRIRPGMGDKGQLVYASQASQAQVQPELPPVPTYTESQRAYYPHGVKRLPHFHPPRFSRRLRTLMSQRQKPHCLKLNTSASTSSNSRPNHPSKLLRKLMPWSWNTSTSGSLSSSPSSYDGHDSTSKTTYGSDDDDDDLEDYRLMREEAGRKRQRQRHARKESWYSLSSSSEGGSVVNGRWRRRRGGLLDPRILVVLVVGCIMVGLGGLSWVLAVRKMN